jgi:hypothetical protein
MQLLATLSRTPGKRTHVLLDCQSPNPVYCSPDTPLPCKIYESPEVTNKNPTFLPKVNGAPQKIFTIPQSKCRLPSPIPHKSGLELHSGWSIDLGYINPSEEQKLLAWIQSTQNCLALRTNTPPPPKPTKQEICTNISDTLESQTWKDRSLDL